MSTMMVRPLILFALVIGFGLPTKASSSETAQLPRYFTQIAYIDPQLWMDCATYSVASRSCIGGDQTAYKSISNAMQAAQPGMMFYMRGEAYKEPLHVTVSGTADARIGFVAYPGEEVLFKGIDSVDNGEEYGPIWLDGVQWIVIDGVHVKEAIGFVRALDAHHNIVRNGHFETSYLFPSKSKRGGLYFSWSHHNKILNNTIVRGTDNLVLVHSNHNLVEKNEIRLAGHDIWSIKCGSYNVIRNNRFHNERQKLGSVFDCEDKTMAWHGNGAKRQDAPVVDATRHNLIEGNVFDTASAWYSTSGGNGIQYAGQHGIVRNNVFVRANVGLGMTHYDSEALYNYGNRVYHNVFVANRCAGISIVGYTNSGKIADNVYKNNVLWDNRGWALGGNCNADHSAQVVYRRSFNGHSFVGNALGSPLGDYLIREEFGRELKVKHQRGKFGFDATIEGQPGFRDEQSGDYRLKQDSALIDKGVFLTQVRNAGSGTQLAVEDAAYFSDGHGIEGNPGDMVMLAQGEVARVTRVDYTANVLHLDRPLTWQKDEGVSIPFSGAAPDIGAFEFD